MVTLTAVVFIITVPCVVFAAIVATLGMIKLTRKAVEKVAEVKEEKQMKTLNELLKECEDVCEEEFEKLLK